VIDFAETKWHSFPQFLDKMQRLRFLELSTNTEDATSMSSITSIRNDHPTLVNFEPEIEEEESSSKKKRESAASVFDDPKFAKCKRTEGSVTLVIMFKPTSRVHPAFEGANLEGFYTAEEYRQRLWDWCSRMGLIAGTQIIVNDALWKLCLKPKKTKDKTPPSNFPRKISRKQAGEAFDNYMLRYHCIHREGMKIKFREGCIQKIGIYVDKRQGGRKHNTYVWRLEEFGICPTEFQKMTRRKFAASTSTQDLPGKLRKCLQYVQIQGSRAYEVEQLLSSEEFYNIPEKFIEPTNKRPF